MPVSAIDRLEWAWRFLYQACRILGLRLYTGRLPDTFDDEDADHDYRLESAEEWASASGVPLDLATRVVQSVHSVTGAKMLGGLYVVAADPAWSGALKAIRELAGVVGDAASDILIKLAIMEDDGVGVLPEPPELDPTFARTVYTFPAGFAFDFVLPPIPDETDPDSTGRFWKELSYSDERMRKWFVTAKKWLGEDELAAGGAAADAGGNEHPEAHAEHAPPATANPASRTMEQSGEARTSKQPLALLLDCDEHMAHVMTGAGYEVKRGTTGFGDGTRRLPIPLSDADVVVYDLREPYLCLALHNCSHGHDGLAVGIDKEDVFRSHPSRDRVMVVPSEHIKDETRPRSLYDARAATRAGTLSICFLNCIEIGPRDPAALYTWLIRDLDVEPARDMAKHCKPQPPGVWGDFFLSLLSPVMTTMSATYPPPGEAHTVLVNRIGKTSALMVRDGRGAMFLLPEFEDNALAAVRLATEIWPKLRESNEQLHGRDGCSGTTVRTTESPEAARDIWEASYQGDLLRIEELLRFDRNMFLNKPDPYGDGQVPLEHAIEGGRTDAVKLLLDYGADLCEDDPAGECTPLQLAVELGYQDMAQLLIRHGADVNFRCARTSLVRSFRRREIALCRPHLTALGRARSARMVELLVNHGAEVRQESADGWTQLHWAALYGHPDVLYSLVKHELSLDAKTENGWTLLQLAMVELRWHQELAWEKTRWLLSHDVDVDARTPGPPGIPEPPARPTPYDRYKPFGYAGSTPLHLAIRGRLSEVAALLIEDGADVNARNDHGNSPLHVAAALTTLDDDSDSRRELRQVASLLLDNGAEIDARNHQGATPLHIAAFNHAQVFVEALLARGADATVEDLAGRMPLELVTLAAKAPDAVSPTKAGSAAATAIVEYLDAAGGRARPGGAKRGSHTLEPGHTEETGLFNAPVDSATIAQSNAQHEESAAGTANGQAGTGKLQGGLAPLILLAEERCLSFGGAKSKHFTEFDLKFLSCLIRQYPRPASYAQLKDAVWPDDRLVSPRARKSIRQRAKKFASSINAKARIVVETWEEHAPGRGNLVTTSADRGRLVVNFNPGVEDPERSGYQLRLPLVTHPGGSEV